LNGALKSESMRIIHRIVLKITCKEANENYTFLPMHAMFFEDSDDKKIGLN